MRRDINNEQKLRSLVKSILNGKPILFHPYSQYATLGAGAIKEVNSFCEIRNEVYKKFIHEILREVEIVVEKDENRHQEEVKKESMNLPQVKGKISSKLAKTLNHSERPLNYIAILLSIIALFTSITAKGTLLSVVAGFFALIFLFILLFSAFKKEEKGETDL